MLTQLSSVQKTMTPVAEQQHAWCCDMATAATIRAEVSWVCISVSLQTLQDCSSPTICRLKHISAEYAVSEPEKSGRFITKFVSAYEDYQSLLIEALTSSSAACQIQCVGLRAVDTVPLGGQLSVPGTVAQSLGMLHPVDLVRTRTSLASSLPLLGTHL